MKNVLIRVSGLKRTGKSDFWLYGLQKLQQRMFSQREQPRPSESEPDFRGLAEACEGEKMDAQGLGSVFPSQHPRTGMGNWGYRGVKTGFTQRYAPCRKPAAQRLNGRRCVRIYNFSTQRLNTVTYRERHNERR